MGLAPKKMTACSAGDRVSCLWGWDAAQWRSPCPPPAPQPGSPAHSLALLCRRRHAPVLLCARSAPRLVVALVGTRGMGPTDPALELPRVPPHTCTPERSLWVRLHRLLLLPEPAAGGGSGGAGRAPCGVMLVAVLLGSTESDSMGSVDWEPHPPRDCCH